MIASVIHDLQICYPDGSEFFSPSEHYPEYPFTHIASRPNLVYQAVRNCLAQAGLDARNFGTSDWNPFGEFINKGKKVFVLCNFVYHKRANESLKAFWGKCTHASVVRALIDYVYISTGPNGTISFGNAPLQSCIWEQVLKDTGSSLLIEFYNQNNVNVAAKDLRLLISHKGMFGNITSSNAIHNGTGITISLDKNSHLNNISNKNNVTKYRVSNYSPDRTEGFHSLNNHKYIINNEIISSDVILSIPKLKTHEKVGITLGLKGFVGCVGHKDCLAHHRFGPPQLNGDEYPENSYIQTRISTFHDFVYKKNYPACLFPLFDIVDLSIRKFFRKFLKRIQAGAWHGNDTTWRMVLDLANIMHFVDRNGNMSNYPQRKHIMLIDGVIAGEGNGPLSPTPIEGKTIIFSDNIIYGDIIACKLMGYDPAKVPLLFAAMKNNKLLDILMVKKNKCLINQKGYDFDNVKEIIGRPFIPPDGWEGFLP